MKSLLSNITARIFMLVFAIGMIIYSNNLVEKMEISSVENTNLDKKLDIVYEIIEREIIYVDTNSLAVGEIDIIKAGSDGLLAYYGDDKTIISEPVSEIAWRGTSDPKRIAEIMEYDAVSSFNAHITGYGPDCKGCRGKTATGYDVTNTVFYKDSEFGNVRIVAADRKVFRYGTIMRVMDYRDWDPFLVIMLDCGGLIDNYDLDLLYPSESLGNRVLGLDKSVEVDILRVGY